MSGRLAKGLWIGATLLSLKFLGACAPAADKAAIRAEADAIIRKAGAAGLFRDVSKDHISLRHEASGLDCGFDLGNPTNEIVLLDGHHSQDVMCRSVTDDVREYGRYSRPSKIDPEAAIKAATTKFYAQHANVQLHERETGFGRSFDRIPERQQVQLKYVDASGQPRCATLLAGAVNGWLVEHEADEPCTAP